MAYEQKQYDTKPNTGTLFPTKEKKSEKSPDFSGMLHLDRSFLKGLLEKTDEDLIKIAISRWKQESKNGLKYLTFMLSEPMAQTTQTSKDPW